MIDTLITDWDASEEDLKKFDELGIEIEIVEKYFESVGISNEDQEKIKLKLCEN